MSKVRYDECKNKPHYFEMFLGEVGKKNTPVIPVKPKKQELGDKVESALAKIGVTEERVSKLIGMPCGCKVRKAKLNKLHRWAARVLGGRADKAEKYLDQMLEDDKEED